MSYLKNFLWCQIEIFKTLPCFFKIGHIKNVQNRFLDSLSHAEIHEFLKYTR